MRAYLTTILVLAATAAFALTGAGCDSKYKIIDHVNFTPSANLEVVRVSIVFKNTIQSDLNSSVTLKNYGYIFVSAYTPAHNFEVGFDLDTSIVNDQDYVRIEPTTVLPNGLPIGIDGRALVEVRDPKPISDKFDLFGYLDVLQADWLGVAAMFKFVDQYFPAGMSFSDILMRDSHNDPAIIGSVFGPTLNPDHSIKRDGGIALFANVRQLIDDHTLKAGVTSTFYPTGQPL